MRYMKLWHTLPMVKPENSLIWCIISFQWNHETYMLGYVQMDSIHSSHLLHHILVGRWYLWFTTCRLGFVGGFYIHIYGHSPNCPSRNIDVCLRPLIDIIWDFDVWCLEKIEILDEGSFDMNYQWFSSIWDDF